MKKVMFVIASAMIMTACGSQETTTEVEQVDSLSVDSTFIDSASVAPISDSVASLDRTNVVL
jgi:hypothetical protein